MDFNVKHGLINDLLELYSLYYLSAIYKMYHLIIMFHSSVYTILLIEK